MTAGPEFKYVNTAITLFHGGLMVDPTMTLNAKRVRLRQSNGQATVHDFTKIDGEPVVRYAQARIMKQSCVDCHNTHPLSMRKNWKVGDVRGVLEIIRPLKNDEARVRQALQLTLLLSVIGSGLLLSGSVLAVWAKRRRIEGGP